MIQLARGVIDLLFLFGFVVGVTYVVMLWFYLGRVRKEKPAPNIVKLRFKPVSRHPFCRRWGCIDRVPGVGYYPGMAQSHCYRCGMITGHADKYRCPSLPDYDEPIGATFNDKMLMKLFPGKP